MESVNVPSNVAEKNTFKNWLGESGQVMAIGIAVCYISGFIIVNSYLGKYGIKDYDAFRTEYLVAGFLFFILIGLWFFFVGRNIIKLDGHSEKNIKLYNSLGGTSNRWNFMGFITPMIDLIASYVFLVVLTAIIFLSYKNNLIYSLFGGAAAIHFFVYAVQTSKASESITKWFYLLITIADLVVISLFLYLMDKLLIEVAGFFLIMTFAMFQFADIKKYIHSSIKYLVSVYLVVMVIVIGSGVIFGTGLYEEIKSSLGGAKPPIVKIVVKDDDLPEALIKQLEIISGVSSSFKLLAQSDKELYLLPQNEKEHVTLRISRDLVKAVISQNETAVGN